jgi:hypothetical protein
MTGYIILGVFILFVVSNFISFITGMTKGYKQATADYNAEKLKQKNDAEVYDQIKKEIGQGVKKDAEDKKAELAGHSNSRDQFNAINDSLSNKPKK